LAKWQIRHLNEERLRGPTTAWDVQKDNRTDILKDAPASVNESL